MGALLHLKAQFFFLIFQAPYTPLVELPGSECDKDDYDQCEPCRLVEIGLDCDLKFRYVFFFCCLVIGCIFHLQRIVSRRQVSVGGKTSVAGYVYPPIVKTKQAVTVGRSIIGLVVECGKFQ